jgi:hypothetical protein
MEPRLFENRQELGADGSIRKSHYGSGRQPWDNMLELGWAPHFAAGCIIRYLRRNKDLQHSHESAKWYWKRLHEMAVDPAYHRQARAAASLDELRRILKPCELMVLWDGVEPWPFSLTI